MTVDKTIFGMYARKRQVHHLTLMVSEDDNKLYFDTYSFVHDDTYVYTRYIKYQGYNEIDQPQWSTEYARWTKKTGREKYAKLKELGAQVGPMVTLEILK